MKKLIYTLLATAIFSLQNSQAQKIAHLSFDSLVNLMPETKMATQAAQAYLSGLTEEATTMQKELEGKYKDYQEKEQGMGELVKKSKQEDLQRLQTRIQEFQRQADQDYRRRHAELTLPIIQKAKKGIEAAAKEGGYKYVLDTSPQSPAVLYSEPGDDILAAAKKKLDAMPPAVIPGVNEPATGKQAPAQKK